MRPILAMLAVLAVAATTLMGAAPAEAATQRIAGADRFATSVLLSQQVPAGRTVFLASGTGFADALAAGPVAAAEGGHLLLVRPESIPAVVDEEIRRLAPREIVIVGSEASVSRAVAQRARQLAPTVTRIGGGNRVDTSMLLFDRMRATTNVTDVWVASGFDFPDALAAGAVAAREGHALILTTGATTGFQTRVNARLGGVQRFHIPGSATSVSNGVQIYLQRTGRAVDRFPGADRYETAVLINRAFTPAGADMVLANGQTFPDGLVGSVYAAAQDDALYLTAQSCATSGSVAAEQRRLGDADITVLGTVSSVSNTAAQLATCPTGDPTASELLSRINSERAAAGRQPLQFDSCLNDMAEGWASTMASQNLSGSAHNPSLTAEARACGVSGWGENVGRTVGTTTPDVNRMMSTWMASTGHRDNILRSTFTHIGIDAVRSSQGTWYYVLVFGSR